MKNLTVCVVALMLPIFLSAQSFSTKSEETGDINTFMEVAVMPPAFKNALHVWYMGDGGKYSIVTDEDAKPFAFKSYPQIFNWLRKNGYEMVEQLPATPVLAQSRPIAVFLFEKK